jgi:hypothetical protein
MNDYDLLLKSVSNIANEMQNLNQQAVEQYSSVVESIIRSRSRDIRHIEHTLDGLMDFCGHEPTLQLFPPHVPSLLGHRPCRHRQLRSGLPGNVGFRSRTGNGGTAMSTYLHTMLHISQPFTHRVKNLANASKFRYHKRSAAWPSWRRI